MENEIKIYGLLVVKFMRQEGKPLRYEVFECETEKTMTNKLAALDQEFRSTVFDRDQINVNICLLDKVETFEYHKDNDVMKIKHKYVRRRNNADMG